MRLKAQSAWHKTENNIRKKKDKIKKITDVRDITAVTCVVYSFGAPWDLGSRKNFAAASAAPITISFSLSGSIAVRDKE
jgi:hypothetical protein